MGKIYQWANAVHIWLGKATIDSGLAIDLIRKLKIELPYIRSAKEIEAGLSGERPLAQDPSWLALAGPDFRTTACWLFVPGDKSQGLEIWSPVESIYTDTTRYLYFKKNCLDLLENAGIAQQGNPKLPTWAPDFNTLQKGASLER
ncbi:hypothetical protein B0O99DRAFT_687261 [Bisporella sp. PMI_857]|nr:hypothetical protein B0O99DRAFT_687261 [Bisporella sp. PMI_857]